MLTPHPADRMRKTTQEEIAMFAPTYNALATMRVISVAIFCCLPTIPHISYVLPLQSPRCKSLLQYGPAQQSHVSCLPRNIFGRKEKSKESYIPFYDQIRLSYRRPSAWISNSFRPFDPRALQLGEGSCYDLAPHTRHALIDPCYQVSEPARQCKRFGPSSTSLSHNSGRWIMVRRSVKLERK